LSSAAKWYVAYVEEMPGVNTQGRTLAEALTLVLEGNRALCAEDR
jgi:predicted RNase H-like HicB family nuclease